MPSLRILVIGALITLALSFKSTLAKRVCEVDAAATDDLGHDEDFKKAGKVRVKK